MKKTVYDITNHEGPIVCLTAYTASIAIRADAHCDLLLVGDSLSMVLYGDDSTQGADMEMMIRHGKAVAKSAKTAFVVVDMPFGSYEDNSMQALQSAQKIMDETGCDGVKLEGGESQADTIKMLVNNDIPIMAHIGLLPQSVNSPDGYRVQGKDEEGATQLMKDAQAVQEAGAFCVVVEAVPEPLAAMMTAAIDIPTIGIGASPSCDGQILVTEDMLGISLGKPPKFVKQYATIGNNISDAIENYAKDVRNRDFPAQEHTYKAKNIDSLKNLKKAS